jgi:hypothetical protein
MHGESGIEVGSANRDWPRAFGMSIQFASGFRPVAQYAKLFESRSLAMIRYVSPMRQVTLCMLLAAGCLAASTQAQDPAAPAATPGSAPGTPASPAANEANGAMLIKARGLYYSSSKAGLKGFDCAVHPDWKALMESAAPGAKIDDNPAVALLNSVKITLHGRLDGGSSLDWDAPSDPAKPVDQASADMLDKMHQGTERSLTGFMQFWSPFVDGSVIPATPDGIEFTNDAKGHTLHADQGGTSLTEVLDNDLVMQQFNVVMGGAKINFSPRYKTTDQGLLVNAFHGHIEPPSSTPVQEMEVGVDYQTIGGFPIPSRIGMEVSGTGKFEFALDGCKVNP